MTTRVRGRWSLVAVTIVAALIAVGCTTSSADTTVSSATTTQPQDPASTASSTLPPTSDANPTTSVPATTTTVPTATTTTTVPAGNSTTTSTAGATSTTTTSAADNASPQITITNPENHSAHQASYDPATKTFRAVVSMSADVSDPDGDDVTIDWYSSLDGYLGSGANISASLVTAYDSSQPYITARATDGRGAVSEDRIQVIVWIESDK